MFFKATPQLYNITGKSSIFLRSSSFCCWRRSLSCCVASKWNSEAHEISQWNHETGRSRRYKSIHKYINAHILAAKKRARAWSRSSAPNSPEKQRFQISPFRYHILSNYSAITAKFRLNSKLSYHVKMRCAMRIKSHLNWSAKPN